MAISKKVTNNGSTGNHGMQEINVLQRRMIEDKFDQESCESTVICHNGCEFTLLGEQISDREQILLGRHIHKNNLCPFCKTINGKINLEYCVENQNKMSEYVFEMDDVEYRTMYKPQGYKFLPAEMIEDDE